MPSWATNYAGIDREPIWNGLLEYFKSNLTGFVTMGRKHVKPPELTPAQQPAFFLVQMREHRPGMKRGLPNAVTLYGFIILYVSAPALIESPGQETELAATTLNGFFKQIDDAMEPDNERTGRFTIGGLVEECSLEGAVDMDPGIFGTQAAAILPLRIVVP